MDKRKDATPPGLAETEREVLKRGLISAGAATLVMALLLLPVS